MAESLYDRIFRRVRHLADTRALKGTEVARAAGVTPSVISRQLRGEVALSFSTIEAVAELAEVPIAELVVPDGALLKQLDADEAALVRGLRLWPPHVRRLLREFLEFFADAPPGETQTRNLHEHWRRMAPHEREVLYGCAVLLRRGVLTPSQLATLFDRPEDAAGTTESEPEQPAHPSRRRS